jgi:hypothetical protein
MLYYSNRVQHDPARKRKVRLENGKQETLDYVMYGGVPVVSAAIEMPSFSLQTPEKQGQRENCNT